jgi:hypothetical protein
VSNRSLSDDQRRDLLAEFRELHSDADSTSSLETFLPMPLHADMLQPRTLVIRGERGAGKTALFTCLGLLKRRGIEPNNVFPGLESTNVRWVEGFSEKKEHPETGVLDQFAQSTNDDDDLRAFWLGHLVNRLVAETPTSERSHLLQRLPAALQATVGSGTSNPAVWVPAARQNLGALVEYLDGYDEARAKARETAYVTYDYLDRIGQRDAKNQGRFASSLLRLWLSFSNRYESLRGKIFVREDLFDRSLSTSSDASKLQSRSVKIVWSTEALYRLLLRHMASRAPLYEWLVGRPTPIELLPGGSLGGHLPPTRLPEEGAISQRSFVTKLAGVTMGSGQNKGFVYRWVPNHIQDAHGAIVPRSLLNIFVFAAEYALERGPKATHTSLFHPSELQEALEKTSLRRVTELAEEHKVVGRLENLKGLIVMANRTEVERRLAQPVKGFDDEFETDGEAACEALLRLGVLKVREDGRIDVPDLYRYGYGIKRKGGVARPK